MSHITKAADVKSRTSDEYYGRAITASLALAAAVIVAAFLLTRTTTAVPAGAAGAGNLTDGFLPGAISAHAAQQVRNAQAVTDGWEARLVPMQGAQAGVRDGWEAGLVGAIGSSSGVIRDGWEAGLVPPAGSGNDVTDGWESSLFR